MSGSVLQKGGDDEHAKILGLVVVCAFYFWDTILALSKRALPKRKGCIREDR